MSPPSAYLALWQVGLAGDQSLARFSTGPVYRELSVEVLARDYPLQHEVIIHRTPTLPIQAVRIECVALGDLPQDDAGVSVTASFGVAATACSGYQLRPLLIQADDALYRAKGAGRNRVVVFDCPDDLASRPQRKSRTEMDAPR